jgi:LPXTG-motif cell wall-anchored protein
VILELALTVVLTNPVPVDEWHTWNVTETYTETPQDASDVAWPQTYLGPGQLTPSCGWVQQDRYKGERSVIDGILADGVLTYGEDFGVVKEWRYVYAGPCTTPTPTAEPTPTVTPEPTATPTATPRPLPTTTPEPNPHPQPSGTPTSPILPMPPVPVPTIEPSVGPTPQHTEAGVPRLAETGGEEAAWPLTIAGIIAIAAGAGLIRRKQAR